MKTMAGNTILMTDLKKKRKTVHYNTAELIISKMFAISIHTVYVFVK